LMGEDGQSWSSASTSKRIALILLLMFCTTGIVYSLSNNLIVEALFFVGLGASLIWTAWVRLYVPHRPWERMSRAQHIAAAFAASLGVLLVEIAIAPSVLRLVGELLLTLPLGLWLAIEVRQAGWSRR